MVTKSVSPGQFSQPERWSSIGVKHSRNLDRIPRLSMRGPSVKRRACTIALRYNASTRPEGSIQTAGEWIQEALLVQ